MGLVFEAHDISIGQLKVKADKVDVGISPQAM